MEENEKVPKKTKTAKKTIKEKTIKEETIDEQFTDNSSPLDGIIDMVEDIVELVQEPIEMIIEPPVVETRTKEQELIDIAQMIQQVVRETKTMSDKEIYESYVSEGRPFLIFFQGRLMFDSTISDKKGLRLLMEGFEIHGRMYSYSGIRFKFKK